VQDKPMIYCRFLLDFEGEVVEVSSTLVH
jgi:hypothetical protein